MSKKFIIYTDGGARGNPGPAAIGVVVDGRPYGESIGRATNNVAEYRAIILGLSKAKHILGGDTAKETDIEVRSDSELAVSQLLGEYRVKNEELKPLFIDVWNAMQDFKSVHFVHIPREANAEADALVNRALDTLL
jgi:ribonuclease HI